MRRILKRRLPVPKFIELAVKAGTYKTPSIRPNYLGLHDDPSKLDQLSRHQREEQRVKLTRGILDYPKEYEILKTNPPLPVPPKTPVRLRKWVAAEKQKRKLQRKKERRNLELLGLLDDEPEEMKEVPGMDVLVKGYLRRYDDKVNTGDLTASQREQQYYSKLLLGSEDAKKAEEHSATIMGRKSQLIENAYEFALRQQQVLLQGDIRTMQESAAKVEELLKMEARSNRKEGHEVAGTIKQWREENKEEDIVTSTTKKKSGGDVDNDNNGTVSLPSIMHSKPRSIRALSIWAARLRSIPYSQWSIGASTALDHWIAREVLNMDENTWSLILEGGGADVSKLNVLNGGETRGGVLDRMRDVVMTREALFPETIVDGGGSAEVTGDLTSELEDETNKSIDALLASLGSFDDDIDEEFKFDDSSNKDTNDDGETSKVDVEAIMNELQVWRQKNVDSPYENWNDDTMKEFDVSLILPQTVLRMLVYICSKHHFHLLVYIHSHHNLPQQWMEKYISTLSSESSTSDIDMEATRKALLSQPPVDSDSSKDFWTKIRTETEAENFLQDYRSRAEKKLSSLQDSSSSLSDKDKALQEELQAILSVPYERQLRKLVDMGSLRPILDEYTNDSNRQNFLEKYSSIFLEGLELEYLVPDPHGPIALEDLGPNLREEYAELYSSSREGIRFRIDKMTYGTDEYGTKRAQRARDMYRMWNEHKSERARFEEALFRKGFQHVDEKKNEVKKKKK